MLELRRQRPRFVSVVLATIVLFVLLSIWGWAVFLLQPFGHRHWAFVVNALVLAWVVGGFWPLLAPSTGPLRRLEPVFGRSLWLARGVLGGALACSLSLIAWSAVAAGGVKPPARTDAGAIRVVSWNILRGMDHAVPWRQHGWPVRKHALAVAIVEVSPDILCVQEALGEQLAFLAQVLPRHKRVGVGRDDGRAGGEHCAIYFDADRFDAVASGTFWLEEPIDGPREPSIWGPRRVCTWVSLRDRASNKRLRVYNTHLYLTESARMRAVQLILAQIDAGDPLDAVLVAGDFNATSDAPSRRLFEAGGLFASTLLAGKPPGVPTYQFYGIRLRSLDEIFLNDRCRVLRHHVIDVKPENTFPSDHFGVLADLDLSDG